jgi:hypothetical protein
METLVLEHNQGSIPLAEMGLESDPHGKSRACELDPQICIGCTNLHFTPLEKEEKVLHRYLRSIEDHDLSFAKVDYHLA